MTDSILTEADKLVNGDRREAYGSPLRDFTRVAAMWTSIIGSHVTAEQAVLCMIAIKLSRETNKHKRDNLVDIAGYAEVLNKLVRESQGLEADDGEATEAAD